MPELDPLCRHVLVLLDALTWRAFAEQVLVYSRQVYREYRVVCAVCSRRKREQKGRYETDVCSVLHSDGLFVSASVGLDSHVVEEPGSWLQP